MASYFITGTGTDIGKTWLSCALLRHWRAAGLSTRAFKPVMSGVELDNLPASDAGQLLLAQGIEVSAASVADISPWRFAAALSPDMAAAAEGRRIDFEALLAFNRRVTSADLRKISLCEGVGGVMVPLDEHHTVLDWAQALAVPVVLVAGSYLGSLSHTLTALQALRSRGLSVAAIAINESTGSSVPLDATLLSLSCHTQSVPLVAVARAAPDAGVAALAHIMHPS